MTHKQIEFSLIDIITSPSPNKRRIECRALFNSPNLESKCSGDEWTKVMRKGLSWRVSLPRHTLVSLIRYINGCGFTGKYKSVRINEYEALCVLSPLSTGVDPQLWGGQKMNFGN